MTQPSPTTKKLIASKLALAAFAPLSLIAASPAASFIPTPKCRTHSKAKAWLQNSPAWRSISPASMISGVFRSVLTNETGEVGTEGNNPEIIDAGEIERHAGEFCSHALAFEWVRHFGVGINDAAGEAAITDKGAKAANASFEAMSFFVVGDGCVI